MGVKQRTCSSSSGTSAMIAMRAQSASPSASRCCAALAPERTERASGVSSSFFELVKRALHSAGSLSLSQSTRLAVDSGSVAPSSERAEAGRGNLSRC